MSSKPMFQETEILFDAFEKACSGQPFEILKPELEFAGKILPIKDYDKDSRNIVNKVLTNFLQENTDPYLFSKNNHIAIKRLGRTFQIIHLFPKLNFPMPSHFIYKDAEAYYIYRTKLVLGEMSFNYLARYQPEAHNFEEQYYTQIPLKVIYLEAEPLMIQPDKKKFVMGWIGVNKKYNVCFPQRAIEEEILKCNGVKTQPFNPGALFDYMEGAVNDLWSKTEHPLIEPTKNIKYKNNESTILMDQLLRSHEENVAIQKKEVAPPKKEVENLPPISQHEVDYLLGEILKK